MGLYFGGELSNIGYYYFNPDSSFIFFKTGFIFESKPQEFKNRFNDTLIGYGKGRWFVEDSFLITKFENVQVENILQGGIKYNASSKAPYDSLFLKVNVTNYDEMTSNIAGVTLFNRFIGNPLGGVSQVTLPLNYGQHKLAIYKYGYIRREITLQPGYNSHDITITLARDDSSTIKLVSEVKMYNRFHYENGEMVFNGKLKKQDEGKEKLALFIKNGFYKFPMQVALLNQILNELN
ncbi:MAG: hypothetical protein ABI685_03420 [Ferruginibacter sp.]